LKEQFEKGFGSLKWYKEYSELGYSFEAKFKTQSTDSIVLNLIRCGNVWMWQIRNRSGRALSDGSSKLI